MEEIWTFVKGFDIQTIISMSLMLWFFSRHIDTKFEKIDAKFESLDSKIQRQSERTDHLYEMFIALLKDKRVG